MTPLAHRLARTLARTDVYMDPEFRSATVAALSGAHFFDVTEVKAIGEEVARSIDKTQQKGGVFTPYTLLPAPNTWIEWQHNTKERCAASLRQAGNLAEVAFFFAFSDGRMQTDNAGAIDLNTGQRLLCQKHVTAYLKNDTWINDFMCRVAVSLAIINSPAIVKQRTHPPRKTVSRTLTRSGTDVGPPHEWHEIKLEIYKPRDIDDGEPHADVITGKRALHFCRKHLRLWNGRLIPVREHWRGDPSIGIRRGYYTAVVHK